MEQRRQAASARASRERRPRGEVSGLQRPAGWVGDRREHRGIPVARVEWPQTAERREALAKDVRARAVLGVYARAAIRGRARVGRIRQVRSPMPGCSAHVRQRPPGAIMRAASVGGRRISNSHPRLSRSRLRSTRVWCRSRVPGRRSVCHGGTQIPGSRADLTQAMKSRDKLRTATLRMLLAAIQTEEVSGKRRESSPTTR